MEPFYREFGDRLRQARKARGMSQADLAPGVGLSRTSVANIERGRQRMSLHLLMEFARELEVEPGALLPPVRPEQEGPSDKRLLEFPTAGQEAFLRVMRRARKEKVDAET